MIVDDIQTVDIDEVRDHFESELTRRGFDFDAIANCRRPFVLNAVKHETVKGKTLTIRISSFIGQQPDSRGSQKVVIESGRKTATVMLSVKDEVNTTWKSDFVELLDSVVKSARFREKCRILKSEWMA